jgi:putative thiamine transport system permease protein
LQWASDPDLSARFMAAAGALIQVALTLGLLGLWVLGERLIGIGSGCGWPPAASAAAAGEPVRIAGTLTALLPMLAIALGLALLILWSLAGRWRFPDALPQSWSLRAWEQLGGSAMDLAATSMLVAVVPTLIAAVLIIFCLEVEHATGRSGGSRALLILYVPLLVPQVTFLFGLQFLGILLHVDGLMASVMFAHLVFVLPYMFLSLADPYRRFDRRMLDVAAGLGMGFWRRLFQVRLPIMIGLRC